MARKPKFKPRITRIKLNPEQAVLACNCYGWGAVMGGSEHVTPMWKNTGPYTRMLTMTCWSSDPADRGLWGSFLDTDDPADSSAWSSSVGSS